jgi:hypothetical protein
MVALRLARLRGKVIEALLHLLLCFRKVRLQRGALDDASGMHTWYDLAAQLSMPHCILSGISLEYWEH